MSAFHDRLTAASTAEDGYPGDFADAIAADYDNDINEATATANAAVAERDAAIEALRAQITDLEGAVTRAQSQNWELSQSNGNAIEGGGDESPDDTAVTSSTITPDDLFTEDKD